MFPCSLCFQIIFPTIAYLDTFKNYKIPFLEYQWSPHIVYEVYIFSSLVFFAQTFDHHHLNRSDSCFDAVPLDVAVTDCQDVEVDYEDMVVAFYCLNKKMLKLRN